MAESRRNSRISPTHARGAVLHVTRLQSIHNETSKYIFVKVVVYEKLRCLFDTRFRCPASWTFLPKDWDEFDLAPDILQVDYHPGSCTIPVEPSRHPIHPAAWIRDTLVSPIGSRTNKFPCWLKGFDVREIIPRGCFV